MGRFGPTRTRTGCQGDRAQGEVTKRYLAGELSAWLGQLRSTVEDAAEAEEVGELRRQAETLPVPALGRVVVRAVELTDCLCQASLERGDWSCFQRRVSICSELWELGTCGGLVHG